MKVNKNLPQPKPLIKNKLRKKKRYQILKQSKKKLKSKT